MLILSVSPDGSRLTVVKAHPDDSGKYTCVATNAAGEEDRIFNLNVYGRSSLFYNFGSNGILIFLMLSSSFPAQFLQ